MGVVYKLNSEIVDFIVSFKKENPSLSCRKLADIIKEKFNIKISKSSVGSILKNAELSSDVGRRKIRKVTTSHFKIPSNKKELLRNNIIKSSLIDVQPNDRNSNQEFSVLENDTNVAIKSSDLKNKWKPKIYKDENNKDESVKSNLKIVELTEEIIDAPEQQSDEPIVPEPDLKVSQNRDYLEDDRPTLDEFTSRIRRKRKENLEKNNETIDGIGGIYFKAFEWFLFQDNFFDSLINKYVEEDLRTKAKVSVELLPLIFSSLLEDDRSKEKLFYALCTLLEHGLLIEFHSIVEWAKSYQVSREFIFEYINEKSQALNKTGCFQLVLKSGDKIYIDSDHITAWSTYMPLVTQTPIKKSILEISSQVISNKKLLILFSAPGDKSVSADFISLLHVLDGSLSDSLDKVRVYNEKGKIAALFDVIPKKRRYFCFGLWPWMREFTECNQSVKFAGKKSYYDEVFDRVFQYTEIHTKIFQKHLMTPASKNGWRCVTIWNHLEKQPIFSLVTNDPNKEAEALLEEFLLSWPTLGESHSMRTMREKDGQKVAQRIAIGNSDSVALDQAKWLEEGKSVSLAEVIQNFGETIVICASRILGSSIDKNNTNILAPTIYNQSGYSLTRSKMKCFYVNSAQNRQLIDVNKVISQFINENMIMDNQGKYLRVICDKTE